MPKAIILVGAALTLLVTVGAFMLMARFVSGPSTTNKFADIEVSGVSQMGTVIPALFDVDNRNVKHDWAIVSNDEGAETLMETSTFKTNGWEYELLLATSKANPEDTEYTVSDALTLTVRNPLRDEEVSYVDLGADGIIESVFVDDANVTNARMLSVGQEQYERILRGALEVVQ